MGTVAQTLLGGAVLAGLLGVAPVGRQQAAPTGCVDPAHRQFDFWRGDWDVFAEDGRRLGRNRIEVVLDGCALTEHWEGASGSTGTSLNAWSPAQRQWRQMWVDGQGGQLDLRGGWDDAARRMRLAGEGTTRDGRPVRHEIAWTPLEDGSVRQRWRQSHDGGATWSTVFDGLYRRRMGG